MKPILQEQVPVRKVFPTKRPSPPACAAADAAGRCPSPVRRVICLPVLHGDAPRCCRASRRQIVLSRIVSLSRQVAGSTLNKYSAPRRPNRVFGEGAEHCTRGACAPHAKHTPDGRGPRACRQPTGVKGASKPEVVVARFLNPRRSRRPRQRATAQRLRRRRVPAPWRA